MSAIATAFAFATPDLPGVIAAAVPVRRLLRRPLDEFPSYLAAHSRELPHLDVSGFVLSTVLPFLSGKGIEFLPGAHEDVSADLQRLRHAYLMFFVSHSDRALLDAQLKALATTPAELRQFYETFNERSEPGIEVAMQKCISFLARAVAEVPSGGLVLICLW